MDNKRADSIECLILVSENEDIALGEDNTHNRALEKHSKSYTHFLLSLFKNFHDNVILADTLTKLVNLLEKHPESFVFSIWSGGESRNRMMLAPALCESLQVPYFGADSYAKTICQDKFISRNYAQRIGFNIPSGALIESERDISVIDWIEFPIVVKPNMEGTSIGICKYDDPKEAGEIKGDVVSMLATYDNSILVEKFSYGREIALLIYGTPEEPNVLGAIEIVNGRSDGYLYGKILDANLKKSIGQFTKKDISDEISDDIYELALKAFVGLGKMDFLRIDGRLHDGVFTFIEFSPIPNFSESSSITPLLNRNKKTMDGLASELLTLSYGSFKTQ